ncbi:hypothetical protein [Endozoicomonas montiporae]|nr:hypothetical protein [Endozoicomonas montiporae]AMO56006.1 hypothetical protein EZMO1_1863 [Endozoicomonas montiporae CL-33]
MAQGKLPAFLKNQPQPAKNLAPREKNTHSPHPPAAFLARFVQLFRVGAVPSSPRQLWRVLYKSFIARSAGKRKGVQAGCVKQDKGGMPERRRNRRLEPFF